MNHRSTTHAQPPAYRWREAVLPGAGAALWLAAAAWAQAPAPAARSAHKIEKVADGVYSAIATGTMMVGSNSAVLVNEREVLIVDSHITPASARALLEEIKAITDKPVRYVVNTHYHFDHSHGNQVFGPDVEIIGHEFTRRMLTGDVLEQRTYKSFTADLPGRIQELKKQAAAAADPVAKAQLEARIASQEAYQAALAELKPTPPNVTLRTSMTLHRGGREIQLHFFGRGHTGGDVVVYLPKERVVCTGDLLTAGLAYMGDAYVDEWIATLDGVKALDFDAVIPGHGEVFRGKDRIERFQAYLRDAWSQVERLRREGVSAADAAKRVDLTAHKPHFPQIEGNGIDPRAVLRMYEVMQVHAAR